MNGIITLLTKTPLQVLSRPELFAIMVKLTAMVRHLPSKLARQVHCVILLTLLAVIISGRIALREHLLFKVVRLKVTHV
jgi:hypothetical protein